MRDLDSLWQAKPMLTRTGRWRVAVGGWGLGVRARISTRRTATLGAVPCVLKIVMISRKETLRSRVYLIASMRERRRECPRVRTQ